MAKRKRKLHKVRIGELSSVDKPAQEGAIDVLMKRDFDSDEALLDFAKRELDMVQPVLTGVVDGHQHLIDLAVRVSRTSWEHSEGSEMGHDHAVLVGLDGSVEIGMSEGHDHTISPESVQRRAPEGEVPEGNQDPSAGEGGSTVKETPMTKQDETAAEGQADERIEALEARLQRAETIGELTDVQKAHFATLDEAGQDEFLSKSAEEREAIVTELEKRYEQDEDGDDPIVYKSERTGDVFRKSAGEAVIGLAKRTDAAEAKAEKLEKAREQDRLEKRASDELGNLPGEVAVKADILRALETVDDQEAVGEFLKAANSGLAKAFERTGTTEAPATGNDVADANAELDQLTKAYVEKNPDVDYYTAYDRVSEANPELLAKAIG